MSTFEGSGRLLQNVIRTWCFW